MKHIKTDHKGKIDITTPDMPGNFFFTGSAASALNGTIAHKFKIKQTKEDKEYQAYQESIGAEPTFTNDGIGIDIKDGRKFIRDLRDGNKYAAIFASVIIEQFFTH